MQLRDIVQCLATLSLCATEVRASQQVPLEKQRPSSLSWSEPNHTSALNTVVPYVVLDGVRQQRRDFTLNVGERHVLEFLIEIRDLRGTVICREPLVPSTVSTFPPSVLFSSSDYRIHQGLISPFAYQNTNPITFNGWYPKSHVSVLMAGTACQHYTGSEPQSVSVDIDFVGAVVEFSEYQSHCAKKPIIANIQGGQELRWGKDGCAITWEITNNLNRKAKFGGVQLMTKEQSYLLIDNKKYLLEKQTNFPGLDSEDGKEIVYKSFKLNPEEETLVGIKDVPGQPLGNGKWKSPTKDGTYTSVGFDFEFICFVMQDWDKHGPDIWQTPIGGNTVVRWGISARADLINGQWTINAGQTRVQQPTVMDKPFSYDPSWNFWVQNDNREVGRLQDDGHYQLDNDPS